MLIKTRIVLATGFTIVIASLLLCCKKAETALVPIANNTTPVNDTTILSPVEPAIANTMGFFLNDWVAKSFTAPAYDAASLPTSDSTVVVTADVANVITKIPESIFGHNANTWMTSMIDQPVFMTHITNLQPHVIRFPAGSGSDVYFWNAAPNGLPADVPAKLLNSSGVLSDPGYGFGKTNDNWRASLDNYYAVLQQSNNTGILTMNYGYARYGTSANPVAAAAHLAADWVRYDNGRTKYWEIGNESYADWEWGYNIDVTQNKDKQPKYLTGALYAKHFKVFADSMRQAASEVGAQIYIGAVTYESVPASYSVNTTKTWNSGMMAGMNNYPDFYIGHNYFTPFNANSNAAEIYNDAVTQPETMINFITNALKTYGATIKPIAMTEWNMFAAGSKQRVSNVSGGFAVLVLAEALKNKYGFAARWDLLNGWDNGDDMALFSDGNEPSVAKWTPRPAFHYLYFFKQMLGDRLVSTSSTGNASVKSYASSYSSGETNVVLVNTANSPQTVKVNVKNFRMGGRFYWYSFEGSNDNGEFSRKVLINGTGPSGVAGGPDNYTTLKARSAAITNGIKVVVPAFGMVTMVIDKK